MSYASLSGGGGGGHHHHGGGHRGGGGWGHGAGWGRGGYWGGADAVLIDNTKCYNTLPDGTVQEVICPQPPMQVVPVSGFGNVLYDIVDSPLSWPGAALVGAVAGAMMSGPTHKVRGGILGALAGSIGIFVVGLSTIGSRH